MPQSIRFGRAGTDSSLSRTTNLPSIATGFTAMFWLKMNGNGSGGAGPVFGGSTPNLFNLDAGVNTAALYVANNTYNLALWNNTGSSTSSVVTPLGKWAHVALTCLGGGNMQLYENGVATISQTAPSFTTSKVWFASDSSAEWSDCSMSAIKVWDRILTVPEIIIESLYSMPYDDSLLNMAFPLASEWDRANYDIFVPKSSNNRWADIGGGQAGGASNVWTETGTLDTEDGPPIQFAPSEYRRRSRRFSGTAPSGGTLFLPSGLDGLSIAGSKQFNPRLG